MVLFRSRVAFQLFVPILYQHSRVWPVSLMPGYVRPSELTADAALVNPIRIIVLNLLLVLLQRFTRLNDLITR